MDHRWITLCLLAACAAPPAVVERTVITMGTALRVEVAAATSSAAEAAAEACVRTVPAADRRWSSWRPESVLERVHHGAVGVPVPADPSFCEGLRLAGSWSEHTGGAFDPTIGRLLEAWGVRHAGTPETPTAADLARARATCGLRHLRIAASTVTRLADARLAEGGFVKGLALDDAIRAAREIDGLAAVNLDFGGQHAWWSREPGRRRLGIASPDARGKPIGWIDLPLTGSVATSGNSERGIVVDGVRHSHILDPRTGRPAPDWGTVTVVVTGEEHPACAADCLSTALFVLGPTAGQKLATELPGVEALFLERTPGSGLRTHRTSGLRGFAPGESTTH